MPTASGNLTTHSGKRINPSLAGSMQVTPVSQLIFTAFQHTKLDGDFKAREVGVECIHDMRSIDMEEPILVSRA